MYGIFDKKLRDLLHDSLPYACAGKLGPIQTKRKRRRTRKCPLMFAAFSLIFSAGSLIFFAFALALALAFALV